MAVNDRFTPLRIQMVKMCSTMVLPLRQTENQVQLQRLRYYKCDSQTVEKWLSRNDCRPTCPIECLENNLGSHVRTASVTCHAYTIHGLGASPQTTGDGSLRSVGGMNTQFESSAAFSSCKRGRATDSQRLATFPDQIVHKH